MGFFGMDVLAIRQLAKQLDVQANEADQATRELTSALGHTEWTGADQKRFAEEWASQHAPAMRRAAQLLQEAAELARSSATAQERTSGA
jgi:uncharacterized protein YukE